HQREAPTAGCIVLTVLIRRIELVLDRLPLVDRIGMAQLRLMPALGAGRILIRIAGCRRGRAEQRTLRHRHGAPIVGLWLAGSDQVRGSEDALLEARILEIAGLLRADRRGARYHDD